MSFVFWPPASAGGARRERNLALLFAAVLVALALTTRSAPFTPDEPREFGLSHSMLTQPSKAVPLLSGEAFCEKPPLTYWSAALAMKAFDASVWAARLPNALWTLIVVWALIACARPAAPNEDRERIAVLTAIVASTMYLLYRVQIWLATDAPLLAGVAVALLGAWRGLNAQDSRAKFRGYLLMHAGLVLAFFAKNLLGWLTPLCAVLAWIAWERRWRELLRWELYAGVGLQIAFIAPWIAAVASEPNGAEHLRIFLIDNTLGRFLPIATVEQYSLGHRNHPGKYLQELPLNLLPWTFAGVGALRFAFVQIRRHERYAAYAKFLLCSIAPGMLFLSLSETARDIYCAPALLGYAALIALWLNVAVRSAERFDRICLSLTAGALLILAVVLSALALGIPYVQGHAQPAPAMWFVTAVGGAALLALLHRWRRMWPDLRALLSASAAYVVALLIVCAFLFPAFDRSQDLRPAAQAIARDFAGREIATMRADETMRAYLEFGGGIKAGNVRELADAIAWLRADDRRVLAIEASTDHLTAQGRLRLSSISPKLAAAVRVDRNDTDAAVLSAAGLSLLRRYAIDGGRVYGVWSARQE